MKITFSNPSLQAHFDDWPAGGKRVQCEFKVHRDKRGWRVSRKTTNTAGIWCKPKLTTYSGPVCIVDGSDGRTYLLEKMKIYEGIEIRRSDFMVSDAELGRDHCVWHGHAGGADDALYDLLLKLIVESGAPLMEVEGRDGN